MIQLVAKSSFDRPKRTSENSVFRSTDISRVQKTLQNDRLSFLELESRIWELQRAFVGVSFIISNVVTEQITVRNPHFVECVGKLRKKKLLIQTQNPSGLLIINLRTRPFSVLSNFGRSILSLGSSSLSKTRFQTWCELHEPQNLTFWHSHSLYRRNNWERPRSI